MVLKTKKPKAVKVVEDKRFWFSQLGIPTIIVSISFLLENAITKCRLGSC
jgi:hypothetical protein